MKPYKLGLVLGRFQTFHVGHKLIIDTAARLCGEVGVFIGSAQESGTEKNPFTYEQRRSMIERSCRKGIVVYPIDDIGVGNNSMWGEYVIERVKECCKKTPDLFISGREARRVDWFDGIEELVLSELYVPKSIEISASEMRKLMLENNYKEWKKYAPKALWGDFEEMRRTVERSYGNKQTKSI